MFPAMNLATIDDFTDVEAVLEQVSERSYPEPDTAAHSIILAAPLSRSNWAKDSSTLSVSRPMLLVVLNDWVTDTNETARWSNSSTSLAKSASERVNRSTL